AEARRAPLVVVGAVPGSGLVDALERKPWRWLAAHAHQPVLVVPARPAAIAPEWRGDEGAPSGPR
ncbi:MAG TPA: hypothetical protein VD838_13990, partial [Anaeromyxobacteraceae bacterium]|nr:hypothetical protein [Anaeromyxobacteraceae bacterium]